MSRPFVAGSRRTIRPSESEATATPPEEAAERARDIAARSEVTADDVIDVITAMREARE